jgi:ubiquinone biosynthesis protein UbiJ
MVTSSGQPPPDGTILDDIARQLLDTWQDHLTRAAQDPETQQSLAQMVGLFTQSMAAFAKNATAPFSAPASRPEEQNNDDATPSPAQKAATHGATAATAASEPANHDVAQLLRRIAALEQRVATLESRNHTNS